MPAHALRAVGYSVAGLAIAGALLLFVGPERARALVLPRSSASASPSPAAAAPPKPKAKAAAPAAKAPSVPYHVVGLGDSVPAADVCDCTSYVDLAGRHEAAARGRTAVISNLAEGGLTTSELLAQLKDDSVRREIADADLVIVTIGANDFDTDEVGSESCAAPDLTCFQSTLKEQKSQLDDVFSKIGDLIGRRPATVLVTGYWNVFLDGDVAAAQGSDYVRNSVALTRAENDQIAGAAERHGGTYVDIFTAFKGESGTKDDTSLLADDGDHPNAAGHRKIAKVLESALS